MPCCLCHPPVGAEDKQELHPPIPNRLTFSFQSFSFSRIFFGGSGGLSNGATLQWLLLGRRHRGGGGVFMREGSSGKHEAYQVRVAVQESLDREGPAMASPGKHLRCAASSSPKVCTSLLQWQCCLEIMGTAANTLEGTKLGKGGPTPGSRWLSSPPEVPVLHALFLSEMVGTVPQPEPMSRLPF